jgi:glycerol-3-phosphate acyltransferase PlsY
MIPDILRPGAAAPGMEAALPWLLAALAIGYLLGSIPFGVVSARLWGLGDLRKVGSGNIGATNVLRTGSKSAALTTLLGDAGKGAVAVLLIGHLAPGPEGWTGWGPLATQAAALGAFLGHLFPVWLGFKGGKGVATFLGIMIALHWPTGLACCATWAAAAALFRISSLSALIAAASAPIWLMLFGEWGAVLLGIVLAALIWAKHHANIRRLLSGEEPKIGKSRTNH